MYSDFIAAANNADLQAFQLVLKENVRDGYAHLKQLSVNSSDINITEHTTPCHHGDDNCTVEEEISNFRMYCVEQSLTDNFVLEPYLTITRAWHQSCLGATQQCNWVRRHFEEPKRSIIINEATIENCSSM